MKVNIGRIITVILLSGLLFCGCSDSLWNELPDKVSEFISEYFPGQAISERGWNDDVYTVKMKGGETLTFSKQLEWRSINDYGGHIPQVLLFDCLPPALYEYLQSTESLGDVFKIYRNEEQYIAELTDSTVIYTISDGSITEPISGKDLVALFPATSRRVV